MTIRDSLADLRRAMLESKDPDEEAREHVLDAIKWLNENEKKLQAEISKIAGTKPWESFNASMRFTLPGITAAISLICNQKIGNIVTMDRYELRIYPPDSTDHRRGRDFGKDKFGVRHEVSRLVRNLDFGQEADEEKSDVIYSSANDLDSLLNVKRLLQPTAAFWKSVSDLKPTK
jgi:hypothetical protein